MPSLDWEKAKRQQRQAHLPDPKDTASYWESRKKKKRGRRAKPKPIKSAGTGSCHACRMKFFPGTPMIRKAGKWVHVRCPEVVR